MTGTPVIPLGAVFVPALAVILSLLFWWDLWFGGGLIGGDLYTYFFPQKQFFVDQLRQGEFPLWNNLAGHGYPLVAESQTGVFYPPHLFYLWLNTNSAYNAVQLSHYILAFIFFWMYARTLGLSGWGSTLGALVYTYSWFPARLCLEWAIIGGAWLPLALWSLEKFLATRHWRYWIVLALSLAMQMLPGHFNLAFITLLLIVPYFLARLFLFPMESGGNGNPRAALLLFGLAVGCAFGTAMVQLLPTWELKQLSQRADVNVEHDPRYGNIPPWFLSQVFNPTLYSNPELDNLLNAGLPPSASTNKVEAHLYFGVLPLIMAISGFVFGGFYKNRLALLWLALGLLAVLYTPGWLVFLTKSLPGFSFFKGPGRFGIVATAAVAILSGMALDRLRQRFRPQVSLAVSSLVLIVTLFDLWGVSRTVGYVTILPQPVLDRLSQSPVRKILREHTQPVRLFSRGANLPTLLGVASTPEYLGIGPAEYYDPETRLPPPLPYDTPPTPEQLDWLRRAGVTHVLSENPLQPAVWPVNYLWSGIDPFLNSAWGRREPLFLYEFQGGRSRLGWEHPREGDSAVIKTYLANEVRAEVQSEQGGTLILTDLNYPGWHVTIDGESASSLVMDQMYRAVLVPPGKHAVAWEYDPFEIWLGGTISLGTLLLLAVVGHLRFWHPGLFQAGNRAAEPVKARG